MRHSKRAWLGGCLAGLGLVVLAACGTSKATQAPPAPAPVVVAPVQRRDMLGQLQAIGAVEAYSNVDVKTQVNGELTGVFFKEGQEVRKGQLLFSLDKRQFEAQLKMAEGALAKDLSTAANSRAQAKRYEALWKQGIVSKEQNDQMQTAADASDAVVEADRAAVENARVQITYCTIYSPIDGRTGNLIVHQGNMVKANADTGLVTINQVRPIYATFTVPEKYLADIRAQQIRGAVPVTAQIPNDSGAPVQGKLSFVDNTVDQATGTIKLKAEFSNQERRLWPGQFVNVSVTLGKFNDAIVVPSQAVQTGQQGPYVFVVKPDMTADFRPVTPGETNQGFTVLLKGVNPGEQVVTDGQLRLAPGTKVEIKAQGAGPQAVGGSSR